MGSTVAFLGCAALFFALETLSALEVDSIIPNQAHPRPRMCACVCCVCFLFLADLADTSSTPGPAQHRNAPSSSSSRTGQKKGKKHAHTLFRRLHTLTTRQQRAPAKENFNGRLTDGDTQCVRCQQIHSAVCLCVRVRQSERAQAACVKGVLGRAHQALVRKGKRKCNERNRKEKKNKENPSRNESICH